MRWMLLFAVVFGGSAISTIPELAYVAGLVTGGLIVVIMGAE